MGDIYSLFGHKGGVGKSLHASHLAVYLHETQGRDVIVVDLDARQEDQMAFFKKRDQAEMVQQPTSMAEFVRLVEKCRKGTFDLVIDCPAADSAFAIKASAVCDVLVMPFKPGANDLRAIGRAFKLTAPNSENKGVKAAAFVNFASNTGASEDLRKVLRDTDVFSYLGHVGQREAFNKALLVGKAVWELGEDKKAIQEVLEVLKNVVALAPRGRR